MDRWGSFDKNGALLLSAEQFQEARLKALVSELWYLRLARPGQAHVYVKNGMPHIAYELHTAMREAAVTCAFDEREKRAEFFEVAQRRYDAWLGEQCGKQEVRLVTTTHAHNGFFYENVELWLPNLELYNQLRVELGEKALPRDEVPGHIKFASELEDIETESEAKIERGEAHYWDTFDAHGNVKKEGD